MDPTNANTALASAFAEELARGGLRRAVVSPGSRSTPLAVALWREPGIEVTVILDERSAGFFALGAAQASGEPVALLCTSGTALANYHPAVAEADESALPLVVLSADRPPELRGIGAGQVIDQIKTFGESVRWFCEVGTHDADDAGLLHLRSVACRALARARGEIRPGPVHLNLPLARAAGADPGRGRGDRDRPAGAPRPRGRRPLTAVTRVDLEPTEFVLDEVAGHIGDAIAGVIIAGRQTDPELREPLAHLARASGFPILAEPTSQMRLGPHDRSYVVTTYDTLLRDEHWAQGVVPELVLRFGELPTRKPLREWLAASGADQIVVDPTGGWNEPTNMAAAILRADPTECASGWAARLEKTELRGRGERAPSLTNCGEVRPGALRPAPEAWLEAEAAAQHAIAEALADGRRRSPSPHYTRRSGGRHRDGDLVYTASSMPIRDQETFLGSGRGRRPLPLQPRRQRDRRARSPRGSGPRTRAGGRRRSSPGSSGSSTTSAGWPRCATSPPRSASSSSTTAAAASSTSCRRTRRSTPRSSRPSSAPPARSRSSAPPPSSTSPTAPRVPRPTSPPPSPPAPA